MLQDCQAILATTRQQARREGGVKGLATPGPATFWGAPSSARDIKYARMYHFEEKIQKIFSPERPRDVLGGPVVGQRYKVRQNVPF